MFDPSRRIGVDEALNHPYLSHLHDEIDEPVANFNMEDVSFSLSFSMQEMASMNERFTQIYQACGIAGVYWRRGPEESSN